MSRVIFNANTIIPGERVSQIVWNSLNPLASSSTLAYPSNPSSLTVDLLRSRNSISTVSPRPETHCFGFAHADYISKKSNNACSALLSVSLEDRETEEAFYTVDFRIIKFRNFAPSSVPKSFMLTLSPKVPVRMDSAAICQINGFTIEYHLSLHSHDGNLIHTSALNVMEIPNPIYTCEDFILTGFLEEFQYEEKVKLNLVCSLPETETPANDKAATVDISRKKALLRSLFKKPEIMQSPLPGLEHYREEEEGWLMAGLDEARLYWTDHDVDNNSDHSKKQWRELSPKEAVQLGLVVASTFGCVSRDGSMELNLDEMSSLQKIPEDRRNDVLMFIFRILRREEQGSNAIEKLQWDGDDDEVKEILTCPGFLMFLFELDYRKLFNYIIPRLGNLFPLRESKSHLSMLKDIYALIRRDNGF